MAVKHELQVDERLENGPIVERGCTDVLCCFIFIAFWIATLVIGYMCLKQGDLNRFMRPVDFSGNKCGMDNAKDFPFLFFGKLKSLNKDYLQSTICVKSCPAAAGEALQCFVNQAYTSCDPLKDESYPSFDLFSRFCIPKQSELIEKLGKTNLGGTNMEQIIDSISKAKYVIMGSVLLAFLSAFLFSFFLENCAGIVITITMIGFYAGLIYLVYITNIKHKEYKTKFEADSSDSMSDRLARFFKACFWMCVAVLAITSCFLLCLFSRILLAIKVIKAAADFVTDIKRIVFVPIVTTIVMVLYLYLWGYISAVIISTGEMRHDKTYPYMMLDVTQTEKRYLYFHLFGLLWNLAVISQICDFIITAVVCIWYYQGQDDGGSPVSKALSWTFFHHLGTIAFGALILAIVWAFRIVAEYMAEKARQSGNTTAECLARCLACMIDCAERFVKFFNKHAFTEVALKGTNFCSSGSNAMSVIVSNTLRFGVLHGLGSLVMVFAKLFIISTVCIACYYLKKSYAEMSTEDSKLVDMVGPMVLIFLIALIVADLFAHIWETSCDVILHCYCIDEAIQSSKGGSAKHATKNLTYALDEARTIQQRKTATSGLNQSMAQSTDVNYRQYLATDQPTSIDRVQKRY